MSKKIIAIALIAISLALVNCKDNSTTDDPEPAKTLNKSLMVNKSWSCATFPVGFYFRSDGNACGPSGTTVLGTWQWLNNSDSLALDYDGSSRQIWYVKYCTETEMSAKNGKQGSYLIFTKQ